MEKCKRIYSVMFFDTKGNLQTDYLNEEDKNTFINYLTLDFTSGERALYYYLKTKCKYVQLLDADSHEEMTEKKLDTIHKFKDINWVKSIYDILD